MCEYCLDKPGMKYIRKYLVKIFLFTISFLIPSCDAPKNNPLDPNNPNYAFVTITGNVQTFSFPHNGISGVSVYWGPSNILVSTDNNGNFTIGNILPVNGKLIFQKNGFRSDTLSIVWGSSKLFDSPVYLYQIPQLDSISIYTVVTNQFTPPGQSYQLVVNSKVSDKDNDIDTVFVENSQLSLRKALDFNVANKFYETTLTTQDLNIADIEQTVGLDFNIIVKDHFQIEYNVGSSKVTRVIKNGVSIQFPANDTTISATPLFLWQRYNTGYPFTYMVEIYTNDFANSQLVYRGENISSDSVSYQLTTPLSAKNYYWVIWVVDQFQNRCRSLPATFNVK